MKHVIMGAAEHAAAYVERLVGRGVAPSREALQALSGFDRPLQDSPVDPRAVIEELDALGSPATMASTGGRFFGFVIGGSLPATVGAGILATAWDQNAGLEITSPVASTLERVARDWLVDILGLSPGTDVGFVTGATMGNFTCLAAARHAVLEANGWDVEARGMFGAPPITVIVGEEVHVSLLKALSMAGFGRERVVRVPVDGQGRMIAAELPAITGPTIVCAQAGNVNTGAFDPVGEIAARIEGSGAWLHVDSAFGLWAAASPARRHLCRGLEHADSLSADAHKWLNVPYDSGLAFVREARHLTAAMSINAAYLVGGNARDPYVFVPEMSRRARGIEVWAALRSLGKSGLAEMIDRNCRQARRFAEGLNAAGYTVLNEVVLNQVLVSFGSDAETRAVVQRVQRDGTCWCGGTVWQGRTAMRISVSSWATTDDDVEASLAAILRAAAAKD